jgi:phosphoglycolate phosphatase-like HAD superfamily hydrolase
MNLFIDLDGTIIDISEKYNYVYYKLRNKYQLPSLDYWKMRSSGLSFYEGLKLLGLSRVKIKEFHKDWISNIETVDALEHDKLLDGVSEKLSTLARDHHLILCTSRKDFKKLDSQVNELGIGNLFEALMQTADGKSKGPIIADYFDRKMITNYSQDWIIGDTAQDMIAGSYAKINSCGVLTGISSESDLIESGSTMILESLSNFQLY